MDQHYDSLWRTIRHMGVPDEAVDDAAQQALAILARRLDAVAPGAEKSFLIATGVRVASDFRRSAARHPATPLADFDTFVAPVPSPEELLDERRAHDVLCQVLSVIPSDLRIVFVLFEIEELPLAEIAAMMEIPVGTVSSRLRRAREAFRLAVHRRSLRLAPMERRDE